MSLPIGDQDFRICPDCQRHTLLVGFWDNIVSKPRTILVDLSFDYDYRRRDKMGRLIVEDREMAMSMAHSWKCPVAPQPPPVEKDEKETKPFER